MAGSSPRPRRPSKSQRRRESAPASRLAVRPALLLLPVVAFAIAMVFQVLLKTAGLASDNPLRIILTPLVAAAVVLTGLRGYPTAGRVRMALMVGGGLFLFALFT